MSVRTDAFKAKVCIVGVGHTDYGVFPGKTAYELGALAFKNALEDCGLSKDQVDGLIVSRIPHYARMAAILGLQNVHVINVTPGEGRQSGRSSTITPAASPRLGQWWG
ncbi:MAG: hypothetical protein ACYC3S_18390 [Chloroflexota bacterium]